MKFKELTTEQQKAQVERGEKQINDFLKVIEAYSLKHDTDPNVLVSTMIAVIGRMIANSSEKDVEKQDHLIDFVAGAIKISLAENGYREMTDEQAAEIIPPWEKN